MKLPQFLLTLGLVAGGILAYDLLRSSPESATETTMTRRSAPTEPEGAPPPGVPVEGEGIAPATLDGTGDDLLLLDLARRMESLERLLGSSSEAASQDIAAGPSEEEEGSETSDSEAETAEQGLGGLNPSRFSREELKAFREKLQWVERQRRLEKAGREIWKWLDKQGVELTPEQQRGVVIHALHYQVKAKKVGNMPGNDDAAKAAKKAEYDALSREFRDELYDLVPSTEADRIITAIDTQRAEAQARRRDQGK